MWLVSITPLCSVSHATDVCVEVVATSVFQRLPQSNGKPVCPFLLVFDIALNT